MFIDSHCHIDFPDLYAKIPEVLDNMRAHEVSHALAVSVDVKDWERIRALIETHPNIYGSVGVHPEYADAHEPSLDELLAMLAHPKVIATGETGLDYYWTKNEGNVLDWQRARFRTHIQAAKQARKPLIIHTRDSAQDTMRILREESADEIGGVMHCFTESREVAQQVLDLGFYISFSGIVSFKNATVIHDTAKYVPLDRILIETDSPYLAPVPYRGKQNQPAYVRHVAQAVASLRGTSIEEIGQASSENFARCFLLNTTY
ncbi:MAG: TatD family deoxyribonuclease [Burkholderiaceae bacterium]|nr:TatD family deoxyribonuclease [Burkholderiaceae bacterium]